MHTSFISSKGTGENHSINMLSDNEKTMWAYETEAMINDLVVYFFRRGF